MKRTILILLLPFLACTDVSEKSNLLLGNWAYLDYELNMEEPYTELYFNDTAYVVQNDLFGTNSQLYILRNDSIFIFECIEKDCNRVSTANWTPVVNVINYSQNEIKVLSESGQLVMTRLSNNSIGFYDYASNDSLTYDWQEFRNSFKERAIDYYIKKGIYKSRDEYFDSLESKSTRTIIDDFDDEYNLE